MSTERITLEQLEEELVDAHCREKRSDTPEGRREVKRQIREIKRDILRIQKILVQS